MQVLSDKERKARLAALLVPPYSLATPSGCARSIGCKSQDFDLQDRKVIAEAHNIREANSIRERYKTAEDYLASSEARNSHHSRNCKEVILAWPNKSHPKENPSNEPRKKSKSVPPDRPIVLSVVLDNGTNWSGSTLEAIATRQKPSPSQRNTTSTKKRGVRLRGSLTQREKKIEDDSALHQEFVLGWISKHNNPKGDVGVNDRTYKHPNYPPVEIEYKAEDGVLAPIQARRLLQLRAKGFTADVSQSKYETEAIIREHMRKFREAMGAAPVPESCKQVSD